jgi:hypothetical protein
MPFDRARTARGAVAGAIAAGVWAAQQPLDKRAFRSDYDDVELLGKALVQGPGWYPAGLGAHLVNGALFGSVYANVAPLVPLPGWAGGAAAALAEHVALWPLGRLSDRVHPARRQLTPIAGNRRVFVQAAWRHALFGVLLGELERRLNQPESELPPYEGLVSPNGHGELEDAMPAGTADEVGGSS